MSTELEIKKSIALLAASYPNHDFGKETVSIYIELLKDIPTQALEAGVKQHISQCKWFPTIAELREAALKLTTEALPSGAEAWAEVAEEMRRVGSWGKPEFSHELIDQAVRCSGGWQYLCSSEMVGIERSAFLKLYQTLHARAQDDMRLLPEVRQLMLDSGVVQGG